jgi:hypothetical protein
MDLNFEKLPRWKKDSMAVWTLIPQWAHAHQVDEQAIIAQLYTAHAWCDSNPKKAPKKQVTRFLWSWMNAAKRYGNLKTKPTEPAPRPPQPEGDMTFEEMVQIRQRNMKRG